MSFQPTCQPLFHTAHGDGIRVERESWAARSVGPSHELISKNNPPVSRKRVAVSRDSPSITLGIEEDAVLNLTPEMMHFPYLVAKLKGRRAVEYCGMTFRDYV